MTALGATNAIDPDLAVLMTSVVVIEPWTGQDAYGQPAFGAPMEYKARLAGVARLWRKTATLEQTPDYAIFLAGAYNVTVKDRITLPDGTQPPIISVDNYPDEHGMYYQTIYVGMAKRGAPR